MNKISISEKLGKGRLAVRYAKHLQGQTACICDYRRLVNGDTQSYSKERQEQDFEIQEGVQR